VCGVKRLLVGLAALGALGAAAPAQASTPMPWCGTDSSAVDRLPDATPGYAVHVAYVRPPGGPDRFGELAPRIVGDAAAIEAWWRSQDATRSLRFDLFPVACASTFGALDITNVELPQPIGGIDVAFSQIRQQLGSVGGFNEPEKAYLLYYDGPTAQSGSERVCGQGAPPRGLGFSGMAVVYLDSCGATTGDCLRSVVGVHELVHGFGAADDAAPHVCNDAHVCDFENDLLAAFLSGDELEALVLDGGRDDYYGHSGSWTDVQDSLFLERLDSPDRTPPSPITGLIVRTDITGRSFVEWRPARDESRIVYRVKLDGRLVDELTLPVAEASPQGRRVLVYTVQAADAVGHLGPPSTVRFAPGRGVIDASGHLLRDTVPPTAVKRVRVEKTRPTVTLRWAPATDGVALRGYRIKFGTRTVNVLRPAITISRSRLRSDVQITAVDRAGNLGPTTFVPLSRLR